MARCVKSRQRAVPDSGARWSRWPAQRVIYPRISRGSPFGRRFGLGFLHTQGHATRQGSLPGSIEHAGMVGAGSLPRIDDQPSGILAEICSVWHSK